MHFACLLAVTSTYVIFTFRNIRHSSFYHHDIKRDRALLLQKKEIRKLKLKGEEKGYTIVPLRIFINERGFAKMEIALAQGKKEFDKRDSIKDRDTKRELDRAMKR
jgi:SsrA-binding protein